MSSEYGRIANSSVLFDGCKEILRNDATVYGEYSMPLTRFKEWMKSFREGRVSLADTFKHATDAIVPYSSIF